MTYEQAIRAVGYVRECLQRWDWVPPGMQDEIKSVHDVLRMLDDGLQEGLVQQEPPIESEELDDPARKSAWEAVQKTYDAARASASSAAREW